METQAVVVLHNIRSAHNVGSIFRTADAVGVLEVYLVGYTPTPIDRFGRARKDILKTALGAERSVAWEHFENIDTCLQQLKERGFAIVAVEQADASISYKEVTKTENMAFVFGNEPDGLSKEVLDASGVIAEIPMHGEKESLNVSVAAGVALYEILH